MFIEKFTDIGFKEVKRDYPGAGWAVEYKYYPEYLAPNHYTLIVFSHGPKTKKIDFESGEYRLYIHNEAGEFVDSKFQVSLYTEGHRKYVNDKFQEIFKPERRESIIGDLIAHDLVNKMFKHTKSSESN